MQRFQSKQERELRQFMATLTVPWRIDAGSKHNRLIVAEKQVGVLCHTRDPNKDAKQLISAVKRRLRELEVVT